MPARLNVPDPDQEFAYALMLARDERRCLVAGTGDDAVPADRAYRIQDHLTAIRLARGERIVGWKLGYTSEAMREQMGVAEPNFGPLTDRMMLHSGDVVPESVIQPKVEPEIALIVGADFRDGMRREDVASQVDEVRAALEVVDSVWCDYRFSWADNTADGSSASHVVLGDRLVSADLAAQSVLLRQNGAEVDAGVGANAMGDPYAALSWLNDRLLERGRCLRAGDIVITGGLCRAVDLDPGDIVTAAFGAIEVEVGRQGSPRNVAMPDGRLGP